MATTISRLGSGGRIVIPAEFREALGLHEGDPLVLVLEADCLKITSRKEALVRARALVRKYVPEGTSLVDELVADREKEAERE